MLHTSTFFEIATILGLAAILGFIGLKLRQPLVIMFLVAGILAGPSGLGLIASYEQIELLAHIGIALLLFIVGLKLDLKLIRTIGPVALATGLGQIVFTFAAGLLIALALGLPPVSAAYVAVALTFSSTIIIVKLLTDKKEIDSLHGQIAVGFLIVQDIAAILALVALTTFGADLAAGESKLWPTLTIVGKGLGLLGVVAFLTRYILPPLTKRLAQSQEMLSLFAVAWAVFLGAGGEMLGFSKEVGAFLAGVSLAATDYRESISARLAGLRDFLLLFFFIALGARLDWSTVGAQAGRAAILSLFVLIGNPVIVMIIMGVMGYRRYTGFMAGLTVAQISEFSLIVAALGVGLGHITPATMGLITLVGVGTILASTYLILYAGPLYRLLARPLRIFERRHPYRETAADTVAETPSVDVIVIGLGKYGSGLAEYLLRRNKSFIGVDFDPAALGRWRARGVPVLYGDMADPEMHEKLPLAKARWLVSTVRSKDLNLSLIQHFKHGGFLGKVALTATNQDEADEYRRAGVHVVFRPFRDAAEQAADALTNAMDMLPEKIDWPVAFREVRLQPGTILAGQRISDIPLRTTTGVSVLAVSRAGRVHFDPKPDFRIFPGDRLVLMGPPEALREAESLLNQLHSADDVMSTDRFVVAEISVADDSPRIGKSLADLQFRQNHGVTVVGIRRGEDSVTNPGPDDRLAAGDRLIVIGGTEAVTQLKTQEKL